MIGFILEVIASAVRILSGTADPGFDCQYNEIV